MLIETQRARACLRAFDFRKLFIEELGWNRPNTKLQPVEIDGLVFAFTPIAEQGGMLIAECQAADGSIPTSGLRAKIDKYITKSFYEHILIFTDSGRHTSLWRWLKHEQGKAAKAREHSYRRDQPGDSLLQRLAGIAFELSDLDDEGKVSIGEVTGRVARAFDVERVTKRFYDQFKTEHSNFLEFLKGVQDTAGRDWYASVMLNRLMFLYFIQKKGFLDGKADYLQRQLEASKQRGADLFYRDFLLTLFFKGLACEESERTDAEQRLLGKIPYLNGGIFLPHQIEEANPDIQIADAAFERLFNFFDNYNWHLDDRPLRQDNEVNPDVLGYIFEKYINQKQMGAYYTKEDITNYICTYTVLPFLLDKISLHIAQEISEIGPYIYDAVSTEDHLPTETDREFTARRKRYDQILSDFADGKISTVNDLITYNLNIREFVEDWLRRMNEPVMLRRFYFDGLLKLTVLDPTCGSGAFLFAAMNILEPLYELCLDKMRQVLDGKEGSKYPDFRRELERVNQHPNRRYFVLKSIIVNNLYGVDIMDEAVEICKLRLFLKLVAQVDDVKKVEPLPDIDFNIRAGNTLVGFATKAEIGHQTGSFRLYNVEEVLHKVEDADRAMAAFRDLQTRIGVKATTFKDAKQRLNTTLTEVRADLDLALMQDYGQSDPDTFRHTHKPFHWYMEFNGVMANGGFDVIVGNPPYVEYSKVRSDYTVRGYQTERSGNLYAFCTERSVAILKKQGWIGFIVQQPIVSTQRMQNVREILTTGMVITVVSTFDDRPSKLFDGMHHARMAIFLSQRSSIVKDTLLYVTPYNKWYAEEREVLFNKLSYIRSTHHKMMNCFPKIGSPIEISAIDKLLSSEDTLQTWTSPKETNHKVFYKITGVGHWMTVTTRPPQFFRHGEASASSREQSISFPDQVMRDRVFAILNSTLFYWFYQVRTNCRDFNPSDYRTFPVPTSLKTIDFSKLAEHFQSALDTSATLISVTHSQTGAIQIEQFRPRQAKPIIDEIDRVLAQHYGFTDVELDFIINYDIKYRMGQGVESEEGDEG